MSDYSRNLKYAVHILLGEQAGARQAFRLATSDADADADTFA